MRSAARVFAPETFTTSRTLDFFALPELTRQIGHELDDWPVVVAKELVDNAIDEAEEAGIPPRIEVTVTATLIAVRDHGRGIPPETVADTLDYGTRTSSRAAYVAPTRGQQGNALKSILPMGWALAGKPGLVEVEAHGIRHRLLAGLDPIAQAPKVEHIREPSIVRNGTLVRVHWPSSACSIDERRVGRVLQRYPIFNPHLHLVAKIGDEPVWTVEPTEPAWKRWRPSDPLPIHWYDGARFTRLITTTIYADRSHGRPVRFLREFINQFRGLSSTGKVKGLLAALDLGRGAQLDALLGEGDEPDHKGIEQLHRLMRGASRPPRAADLGVIGRDHLQARLGSGIDLNSFQYRRRLDGEPDRPSIVETCFAYRPGGEGRTIHVGLNHSPALAGESAFPRLSHYSFMDRGLGSLLAERNCDHEQPITVAVHLVAASLAFTDAGKSKVALHSKQSGAITAEVEGVTTKWHKIRELERRNSAAKLRRSEAFHRERKVTLKDAAWDFMERAYMKAGGESDLPVNARQIMYAARPHVFAECDKIWANDDYFIQTLLRGYMATHKEKCAKWRVVFDERGFFREPHGGVVVDLGTLVVQAYIADLRTRGPQERYSAVLYVEKSGFEALFNQVKLADRHDLGIIYGKGQSVFAARDLIEAIDAAGVPVYCIRDFDTYGFSIARTLREDTEHYHWQGGGAIDLGLRLEDVRYYNAVAEPVHYKGAEQRILVKEAEIRARIEPELLKCGATPVEIAFLVRERVELNGLTAGDLVDWIEAKLALHHVAKILPGTTRIEATAESAIRARIADEELAKIIARARPKIDATAARIAKARTAGKGQELRAAVETELKRSPALWWNTALTKVLNRDLLP